VVLVVVQRVELGKLALKLASWQRGDEQLISNSLWGHLGIFYFILFAATT